MSRVTDTIRGLCSVIGKVTSQSILGFLRNGIGEPIAYIGENHHFDDELVGKGDEL